MLKFLAFGLGSRVEFMQACSNRDELFLGRMIFQYSLHHVSLRSSKVSLKVSGVVILVKG